jgi:hypothetical protein
MAATRRWDDLTDAQQKTVLAGAAVELFLTAWAVVDLSRRPAAQVRGPKPLWTFGCFVQPVGPIAYLAFGRKR